MNTRVGSSRGFTLIELLVCLAIIAVVMSIVMPSMAGVRSEAKRLKCLTNLKGFGVAFELYRKESKKDLLPYVLPFHDSRFPSNPNDPQLLDVLAAYMDVPPPRKAIPDDPNSALIVTEPYLCPADVDGVGLKTGFSYEYWAGVLMVAREIFRADKQCQFTVSRFYEANPDFPVLADASPWHKGNVAKGYQQNALYFGQWRADWLMMDPSKSVP